MDVAQILTAIGTVGSLVTAVAIFSYASSQTRSARRESQAVKIDGWIDSVIVTGTSHQVKFSISNASDLAARQFYFELSTNAGPVGILLTKPVVPPTAPPNFLKLLSNPIPTPASMTTFDPDTIRGFYRLEIRFTDSAGRMWRRNFQGRLTLLHDPASPGSGHRGIMGYSRPEPISS